MSTIIVDASVGVKWFLPEVHAAEARAWRHGGDELHVPAFFFDLEIAKKMSRAGCVCVFFGFESGSQKMLDQR